MEPPVAVELAVRARRLGNAVRVEHHPVAGAEVANDRRLVGGVGHEPQDHPALVEGLHRWRAGADDERRRMSGRGIGHRARNRIDQRERGRDVGQLERLHSARFIRDRTDPGSATSPSCTASAIFTIDATSAAGTPWPDTSATRMPRCPVLVTTKS